MDDSGRAKDGPYSFQEVTYVFQDSQSTASSRAARSAAAQAACIGSRSRSTARTDRCR